MKKQKANSHEGITWFEMGKQNIQAKEVYYNDLSTEYKNGSTDYHDQKYPKTVTAFHLKRCSALVSNSNNDNHNDNLAITKR